MISCSSIFNFRNVNILNKRNILKNAVVNIKEPQYIMPKNTLHLKEIQKQRLKNKEKLTKYVPGRVTLQVLGTGANGAPKCLYIFSDQTRYLFNCGEGTQRLAHELKLKLSKLEHIFVTRPVWQNIGGLPGITLTIQDVGVPNVNIHGPSGMQEMFDAAKKFVVLKNLKLSVKECKSMDIFEDNVLKVQYVEINRDSEHLIDAKQENKQEFIPEVPGKSTDEQQRIFNEVDEDNTNGKERRSRSICSSIAGENSRSSSGKSKRRRRRRKSRRCQSRSLSLDSNLSSICDRYKYMGNTTKDKGISMCYICRLLPKPGAISVEKCVAHGIPPGPLLGKLKAGEEVELADGTVVKPEEVCEPNDPGPIFIVVDCPTKEYINSLVNNEEIKKYQRSAKNDEDASSLVVHFSPKEIMEDPRYEAWMDMFLPSTKHLIINETNTCMGSASVHRIQHKLNMVHPQIFPFLGDDGTQVEGVEREKPGIDPVYNRIQASTLTGIHLRPRKGLDHSEEVVLKPKEYREETICLEGLTTALQDLNTKMQSCQEDIVPKEYPRILFLGTGSCIPNKTRNTSGILLEAGKNQNILIDCGEGTYGQIVRFFGRTKCNEVLANIDAIYVSHIHADHHIGIIGVMQGRKTALKHLNREHKPLKLLAPLQLFPWLSFYDRYFEEIKSEFEFISNSELLNTGQHQDSNLYHKLIGTLNLQNISTCLVKHCPNAYGVAFTLEDGFKLTYSGDTMPCEELVMLGLGSDLLIHEATMEDDLEDQAKMKMHSTTTQAIMIGKRMRAKYILLTHFSQRYAKLPIFNENFGDNVGIAFDNMMVKMDNLGLLPHFNPVLKKMFVEHYDEMELKTIKRQLKVEKQNNEKRKIMKTH